MYILGIAVPEARNTIPPAPSPRPLPWRCTAWRAVHALRTLDANHLVTVDESEDLQVAIDRLKDRDLLAK
jgi:type VI protein secretion system component VasA